MEAIVREWHDDLGWGVLDSVETPRGCWTHYSVIATPLISHLEGRGAMYEYKSLSAGDVVELEWEELGQDGFAYTAVVVRLHR